MDNPLNNLSQNIISNFVNTLREENVEDYNKVSTLIRIHSEKLEQCGDVSFPAKTEIWLHYFSKSGRQLIDAAFDLSSTNENTAEQKRKKFVESSLKWQFPVEKLIVKEERIHLYLSRSIIIINLISDVLKSDNYGHLQKMPYKHFYINPSFADDQDNLTFYRSKLVYNALKRLFKYSRWNEAKRNEEHSVEFHVQSVASKLASDSRGVLIKCGLAIDPTNNGKVSQIRTNDYIRMRSNDMTLLALHKYGVRAKQDVRFCALMDRLGSAAATVDLLEVKHTSPVKISRNRQGSTKGASFILYNSARLETILKTFEGRIDERIYDPLPQIDTIQLNILKEEEEWQLVYVYLAGFPNLIERCMNQIESGLCSTHLIIHFLHGLASTFSGYYRRIKILTENRDHLMPYVYARIYLIKSVREILNKTLALLDIEPVEFM